MEDQTPTSKAERAGGRMNPSARLGFLAPQPAAQRLKWMSRLLGGIKYQGVNVPVLRTVRDGQTQMRKLLHLATYFHGAWSLQVMPVGFQQFLLLI